MSDDAHSIYKKRWDADKAKWEADSAKLAMFDELVEALSNMPRPSVQGNIAEFGARVLAWQSIVDRTLSRARKLQGEQNDR